MLHPARLLAVHPQDRLSDAVDASASISPTDQVSGLTQSWTSHPLPTLPAFSSDLPSDSTAFRHGAAGCETDVYVQCPVPLVEVAPGFAHK